MDARSSAPEARRLESAFRLPGWRGRSRRSTVFALGLLAGGVVSACIPGRPYAFLFWSLGSWGLLLGCITWHVSRALWFAMLARVRSSVLEAFQVVALVLAALLFLPLFALSDQVAFVERCVALRAQALALPDDGGPRFAWREGGDSDESQWQWRPEHATYSGLAYDASGQILRPAWLRSRQWNQRAAGGLLARDCWRAQRIVGPFYRWDASGCV